MARRAAGVAARGGEALAAWAVGALQVAPYGSVTRAQAVCGGFRQGTAGGKKSRSVGHARGRQGSDCNVLTKYRDAA